MDSKSDSSSIKDKSESLLNDKEFVREEINSKKKLAFKGNIEQICDENIITLHRIHAILLNCRNLSKEQKFEFAESERYFMKLHLKEVLKKLNQKKSSNFSLKGDNST